MSESIEHALEHIAAGVLFCMAFAVLFLLHGVFLQQVQLTGRSSERFIMTEQSEEEKWNRSDEQ